MTEQPRDVWGSVVPVDVVGSDEPGSRREGVLGSAAALASGGAVVGVLAVVISVVMAAGIFAAASLSGGGPQPEEVLPGTSFAFAKIDLDPSGNQKLAIRELASKFPDAPAKEADGLRDTVIEDMLESSGSGLSFDRDVKPWLGSRAGVAGFRPAGGDPTMVVAIQTKDRAKTDAALRKASADEADVAFDFRDGYVIITDSASSLDYALDSIDKGSLADDPEFASDLEAIGDDQLALAWVDNAAMAEATGMAEYTDEMPRGRSVMGLHAESNFVELESIAIASGTSLRGGGTGTLRGLPADTAAALFVHDPTRFGEEATAAMGATAYAGGLWYLPMAFLGGTTGTVARYDDDESSVTCSAPPTQPGAPPAEPICEVEEDETGDPTPFGGDWQEAGEIFSEELLPLLRDELTVALAGFPRDAEAPFRAGMVAKVNGPGNAIEPFEDFLAALGVDDSPVRLDGDRVIATTERGYSDQLARNGGLGDDDLFRDALGELGDSVVGAMYVNLDAMEKTYSEYPAPMRPVDAVGASLTSEGDRVVTRLRIVVR